MEMPQATDDNDDWVDMQDDEEEAQWNKLRQERDKFLEEKMVIKKLSFNNDHNIFWKNICLYVWIYLIRTQKSSSNEIEDELCNSQIFKCGLEVSKKVKHNEPQRQNTSPDKKDSSENIEPIMPRNLRDFLNEPNAGKKSQMIYVRLLSDTCGINNSLIKYNASSCIYDSMNKKFVSLLFFQNVIQRRSLLIRGEESLARIASWAKQSDSVSHAAYAKNFIFHSIEPQIDDDDDDDVKNENKIREEDRNSKVI